jgi:hypothetical protein
MLRGKTSLVYITASRSLSLPLGLCLSKAALPHLLADIDAPIERMTSLSFNHLQESR